LYILCFTLFLNVMHAYSLLAYSVCLILISTFVFLLLGLFLLFLLFVLSFLTNEKIY